MAGSNVPNHSNDSAISLDKNALTPAAAAAPKAKRTPPPPPPKSDAARARYQDWAAGRESVAGSSHTDQVTAAGIEAAEEEAEESPWNPPNDTVPYQQLSAAEKTQENAAAAQQAENTIDAEENDYDDGASDAGYETDSVASASTSLSSSVRDYTFENGRRYHKFREGSYNFPNDDSEQDREDMKHTMMINLCQTLHFAPIGPNPQNVLDMGTGTGIWAIELGDQYPSASILGVDLSPIQPEWVPANVRFMVDDVESPWLHPRNHFDYIHSRHTVMAFRNWPQLMRRAYNGLLPGGWMELQEIHHIPHCHDGTMPPNHIVAQYWDLVTTALANLGVNFNATLLLSQYMREAGFVNVTERIFHVPIGIWPKNKVLKMVGLYWRTILMDGLLPIALGPLTRGLKWSKEQVEVFLIEVRKGYMEGWVHSHMPLHVIYGQRPVNDVVGYES